MLLPPQVQTFLLHRLKQETVADSSDSTARENCWLCVSAHLMERLPSSLRFVSHLLRKIKKKKKNRFWQHLSSNYCCSSSSSSLKAACVEGSVISSVSGKPACAPDSRCSLCLLGTTEEQKSSRGPLGNTLGIFPTCEKWSRPARSALFFVQSRVWIPTANPRDTLAFTFELNKPNSDWIIEHIRNL